MGGDHKGCVSRRGGGETVPATAKHLVLFSFFSFQAAYFTVPFYWAADIRVLPKAVRSDRVDFSTEH
jgi:hypothetical protein